MPDALAATETGGIRRRDGVVGGRITTWLEAGAPDGPPVLLLHGSGIDDAACAWTPVIGLLAGRARIVAPDLPGYGGTDPLPGRAGIPEMLGWTVDFRTARGLGPAVVAGLSMGGAIAIGLALERPGAVRALVPVASYGVTAATPMHPLRYALGRAPGMAGVIAGLGAGPAGARRALSAIYGDPARIDAATVAAFRTAAARQARSPAMPGFLRAEMGPARFVTNYAPRLREIAAPVTFVHGTRDRVVPATAIRAAANACGAARRWTDAGHWPNRETPGAVAHAIAGHLSSPAPRGTV